jgi:two-component system, OmpR family, phosphate regulon sensor histidine kinase PhoR
MKRKIYLYSLVIIVVSLAITGFFTSWLTRYYYTLEVKEKLKNTATLLEYQVLNENVKGINIDYDKLSKSYSNLLNHGTTLSAKPNEKDTRITFIDFKGHVLGDSEADFKTMENHLERKEVQEAIKGKIGEDIRKSKTLGIDFLYIAVPIKSQQIIARVSVPFVQLNSIYRAILIYTIIVILVGLLLIILLSLRFTTLLLNPIDELILVSGEIAKGNYSKRVNIKSKDELGQLADTFNRMTAKLEETLSEMMDKNVKVDSIINSMISGIVAVDTKYRIILINSVACEIFGIKYGPGVIGINMLDLIRNNHLNSFLNETIENNIELVNEVVIGSPQEKVLRIYTNPIKSKDTFNVNSGGIASIHDITNIKKLEQIRTEFVSNVTHELKTPLTSIRGFIETLRGGAINNREVAEKFLEIIDIEAERLYMLINDILQLSEIETTQKDSNLGSHNLKSIVSEIYSILQGSATRKDIKLINEADENLMILANRDRIKQMLINLVDNSIKYSPDGCMVTISAYKSEGKIIIIVTDTGIGIAEVHLTRIFERFYRVDKGRSRNMGGTGLGLSIVKHIVNLYSGDIKVNSELGKGTEFIIQLPM